MGSCCTADGEIQKYKVIDQIPNEMLELQRRNPEVRSEMSDSSITFYPSPNLKPDEDGDYNTEILTHEAFGVRAKRHVEDLNRSGFKQFPIPFIGAEVGIKYKDPSNRDKGGEAYVEILDLASLVPRARSRKVQLHAKFDGGASNSDGLFTMEVDYHFQHKDGSGTEEGSMKVVREKRGGMWHTDIKTEAHPFSGPRPIIPARVNSMEFEVESDRQTKLKGKYVNANMGRDITWDIVRQPGKNIKAVITRGGVTSTIEGTLNRSGQDMDIIVKADIRGVKYDGKASLKSAADKTKVDMLIKKGSESVLQMSSEVQIKGSKFRLRSKYSIMGGKVAQGEFSSKYQNNKLTFEAAPHKLDVELHFGRSIKVEAFNGGNSMWTYETLREDKSTPAAIQWEANSKMTLNPASKLYKFIQDNYPFGAFQTRTNNFKLFIDRNNRNFLLRKFKINFDVVKDGQKVIDISGDTTTAPYQFSFSAPNLFERLNIAQNPLWWLMVRVRGFWAMFSLSNRLGALKLNWYGAAVVSPEMSMTFCPSFTTSKLILNLRRRKFLLFLSMKSLKLLVLVWKAPKG